MYDQISPLYADEMSATRSISVVDVYDIAASIGKEFETLIDTYGPQAVTELMPKVINILEHLEGLAGINQKEDAEIQELRFAVKQLQSEKSAKAEERERYEKELEQIEESWRKETSELIQSVNRLREEKRQLQTALQEQEGHTIKLQQAEEEISVLTKMKETVDRQREELRVMKREATQKASELETAQAQCERLTNLNAEYRRKANTTQRQSKQLIQDKAELQAQLHDRDQDLGRYKERVARQDSQEATLTPLSDDELEKMINRLQREGKMVVDLADPHRPRFSINELQDVLQEKNELKTKLIEAEEELAHYKGDPPDETMAAQSRLSGDEICLQDELEQEEAAAVLPPPARLGDAESSETVIHSIVTGTSRHNDQTVPDPVSFRPAPSDGDDDAPVQGPINREPLDKLYPDYKEDSGIRRLFKFLVGPKQSRRESLKLGSFRRSSMK